MSEVVRSYSSSIGHRADPHRHEKRTRLKVSVRPNSLVLGACKLKHGEQVCEVPESVVDVAKGLVEDSAKLEAAREALSHARAAWDREHPGEPFMGSLGKSFRTIYHRDPHPLDLCEVVEEGISPELSSEDRRVANVVSSIAAAIKGDNGGPANNSRGKRGNQ